MEDYEAKDYYQHTNTAEYYDSQFHRPLSLSNLRVKIFGWREEKVFLRMLRQVSSISKKALDIASGTGRYVELLLNHGYQVGGVDISKEMLSFAKQGPKALAKFLETKRITYRSNPHTILHKIVPKTTGGCCG